MVVLMLAHYETFNCTIIQWRTERMACAALSARLLEPWKPISDPVQRSKWAGPGTFRNGSLACNIIRNTLGYHLIFLQCDHMRRFVLKQGAQVWLVTLHLGGCCSPPLPSYRSRSRHSWPRFMLRKLALGFQDITKSVLLWDMHLWRIHVTFGWMGFSSPVKSNSLNP